MTLDNAADQLRRLSTIKSSYFDNVYGSSNQADISNFAHPGEMHRQMNFYQGRGGVQSNNIMEDFSAQIDGKVDGCWPNVVKHEENEIEMHVARRRKTSLSSMNKLFPRARENSISHPSMGSIMENPTRGGSLHPLNSPSPPIFKREFDEFEGGANHQLLPSYPLSNPRTTRGTPLSPPLVTQRPPERSSFCAMIASLEEQLQQYGNCPGETPTSVPPLFTQPRFTPQIRELAHELQSSTCGFSAHQVEKGSGRGPMVGLELLHTTAVRRRSSLTELCELTQRRGSLSNLMQGVFSSNKTLGKKRSRSNMESEDQILATENKSFEGILGASLRPSIISAFSLLQNGTEDCDSSSLDSNFPVQIQDWMNGYYLDDAVRDLEKDDMMINGDMNFPNISQSKLRASVYVLLSVLSTADGEMAATGGSSTAAMMSPLQTYSPLSRRSIETQNEDENLSRKKTRNSTILSTCRI
jgi:hypothetical protein